MMYIIHVLLVNYSHYDTTDECVRRENTQAQIPRIYRCAHNNLCVAR